MCKILREKQVQQSKRERPARPHYHAVRSIDSTQVSCESIATLRGQLGQAVGLFGAIELRNISGQILVEHAYHVSGSIVALGRSPKTEYMWFETALNEAAGERIAETRMLLRFMKASSPLYQDAIAS